MQPAIYGTDKNNYGGAKGDRTPDLLRARQALSQLSYSPIIHPKSEVWFRGLIRLLFRTPRHLPYEVNIYMVGPSGLEPPTSPLSGVRSNQLS